MTSKQISPALRWMFAFNILQYSLVLAVFVYGHLKSVRAQSTSESILFIFIALMVTVIGLSVAIVVTGIAIDGMTDDVRLPIQKAVTLAPASLLATIWLVRFVPHGFADVGVVYFCSFASGFFAPFLAIIWRVRYSYHWNEEREP